MNKTILFILLIVTFSISVTAFPAYLDQQGILRNATDGSLINGTHNFNITIYNRSDDSTVYTENRTLTLFDGVWDYQIGYLTDIPPEIFMSDLYFKTRIDSEVLSAVNFTAVPYSFYSVYSNRSTFSNNATYADGCGELDGYSMSDVDTWISANITKENTTMKAYVDSVATDTDTWYKVNATTITNYSGVLTVNETWLDAQYLDDTTIGNCSVSGSCSSIAYMGYSSNVGALNLTDNSIIIEGTTIKQLVEKNANIDGTALGFYQTGPSGQDMPHFILQSGGGTQASVLMRSVMIVNEIAGFHNTSNATDCVSYMNNISETLKIDCNTTTTGADLLVSDDMQVVGDFWLKDENEEWHHLENTLTHLDNLQDNIILDNIEIQKAIVGGVLNVTIISLNGDIEVNIDEVIYDLGRKNDTVALTSGTNESPQINYVYYKVVGNEAVLTATTAAPSGFEYSEVVNGFIGDVAGTTAEIFGFFLTKHTNYEFIDRVYKRFQDGGTQYISGFDTQASTTELNISVGSVRVVLEQLNYANEHNLTTGFWVINSTGNFTKGTDLSIFTEYQDGTLTGVTDRINVVWGLIPQNRTISKLVAIIPNNQGGGNIYNSDISAEEDIFDHTNFFPSNTQLKAMFIPIAKTIVRPNDDEFVAFQSGEYFKFIAGQVTSGGSAPTSAVSDHGNLDGLGDDDHNGIYYSETEVDNLLTSSNDTMIALISSQLHTDTNRTDQDIIDVINFSDVTIQCTMINFTSGIGSAGVCDGTDATGAGGSQWPINLTTLTNNTDTLTINGTWLKTFKVNNATWANNASYTAFSNTAYDLSCTDCIGGTEITVLTDADVSNTLTCSILTDDDTYALVTGETFTGPINTTGDFNINNMLNVTASNGNIAIANNITTVDCIIGKNGGKICFVG